MFQRAVRDPALQKDVKRAVAAIRTQGMAKGHPKVIDLLWPTGTTARSDIESLFALRKQVPELVDELRQQLQEQSPETLLQPSLGDAVSAPDPAAAFDSFVKLATDPSKQEALLAEVKDLARRTPKGLETPSYSIYRTLDGPMFLGKPEPIELRQYAEFTVARTATSGVMSSSGAGFNTLASYLFGNNKQQTSMAMTMPVEVTSSGSEGSMAFVLPAENANAPPAPLDGADVTIDTVPERLVAVTSAFEQSPVSGSAPSDLPAELCLLIF